VFLNKRPLMQYFSSRSDGKPVFHPMRIRPDPHASHPQTANCHCSQSVLPVQCILYTACSNNNSLKQQVGPVSFKQNSWYVSLPIQSKWSFGSFLDFWTVAGNYYEPKIPALNNAAGFLGPLDCCRNQLEPNSRANTVGLVCCWVYWIAGGCRNQL
jgi:hypothetical protein